LLRQIFRFNDVICVHIQNLLYCAKHQGKILTKQQIYEEVWGEEYFYDDSNIMAIISRLRKKLEVNPSSPKYIQTVKGIGYRFNKEV
jgi:two-component system, OmpR family, response regulator